MGLDINIAKVSIFGVSASETIVISACIALFLIISVLLIRVLVIPKFKQIPRGLQNVLELIVEACEKFSLSTMGEEGAHIAGYVLTIAAYILCIGWVELLGLRSPLTDLNIAASFALVSFLLINAFGFKKKGLIGRIRRYANPITLVTDLAAPVSLACRIFGNLLGGMIIMELVTGTLTNMIDNYAHQTLNSLAGALSNYAGMVLPVAMLAVLPGILSVYFNIFHVALQAYIFTTLTMTFIREAID